MYRPAGLACIQGAGTSNDLASIVRAEYSRVLAPCSPAARGGQAQLTLVHRLDRPVTGPPWCQLLPKRFDLAIIQLNRTPFLSFIIMRCPNLDCCYLMAYVFRTHSKSMRAHTHTHDTNGPENVGVLIMAKSKRAKCRKLMGLIRDRKAIRVIRHASRVCVDRECSDKNGKASRRR